MTQRIEIVVPKGTRRTRLEEFVFGQFPGLSRMYLRRVIKDEKCEVNGRLENVGFRVRGGDFIEVELDPARENSMRPENVPIEIVYEDDHFAVVVKPAGMLVHPTNRDKNGTLLNALAFHFNEERGLGNSGFGPNAGSGVRNAESALHPFMWDEPSVASDGDFAPRTGHPAPVIRPGLVHRLDRLTSGVMVIAKNTRVHRALARQFQRKTVEKKYVALVDGVVDADEGVIDGAIGRYAHEKRWDLKAGAKTAVTRFSVLQRNAETTLLELEPVTGRTNQLRIHCASIGHPIVGDVMRGGSRFARLCLHAYKLSFDHPIQRHRLTYRIAAPVEFDLAKR